MSDEITHRLSAEGVDPLALAGVNDGNLIELAKRLGVRVSLRGDTLLLQGPLPAVERAAQVAQALVDLARMGETLEVADVDRMVGEEAQGTLGRPAEGEYKIILPGLRRVIQAKSAGQRQYLEAIAQHDIVVGIGPAGTGKTYWRWRPRWTRCRASGCAASCWRGRPSRPGRAWGSCRGTCTRKWIPTCGRCTTRSRT